MNGQAGTKSPHSAWIYLSVSLIAFFPCLFLDQAYFANDLLHQYSHFRALLRSQLMSGHFPLWNPYFLAGQPFFADPNVMMCYPLNYLTLPFPIPLGFGVFNALHMFLAACGMHFWLRSLKLSENACRMGALSFSLSGFFWWELIHPPILAAYAWFPWLMACLEQLVRKWRMSWAFAAGLVFALVFTCGNFQSTTCVLYTSLLYFFLRLLTQPEAPQEGAVPALPWKKMVLALLFALWGGLPLAAHLFPADEFSKFTNRRDPGQTYENFAGTFSMRPASTYEFLFPGAGVPKNDTLENAIQGITDQQNIDNGFLGAFGFLGVWAPFLAFFAFQRKDKRFVMGLLGLALAAVLVSWGRYFPLHRVLCSILPLVDLSRAPFRTLQAYDLFLCVLLAYGFQALERKFGEKSDLQGSVMGAGVYGFFLLIAACSNLGQNWREILGVALGAGGFYLWCLSSNWRSLGKMLFQTALVLPLLLSGWMAGFSLGPSANFDLEMNFPGFTWLKAHAKEGRFYLDQTLGYPVRGGGKSYLTAFPQDAPMELGVRTSNGYNPIFLKDPNAIQTLPMQNYLRLLAVRGMLFGQDRGENKQFKHSQMGMAHLYEPVDPVGMATAPMALVAIPDGTLRLGALQSPNFDPRTQAILSAPLPAEVQARLTQKRANFQFDRTMDEADHQAFQVKLDKENLVVFSEIVFPGWKALLDGTPAPLLTANHVFRAIVVPAGEHRVEFLYEPSWAKPLVILVFLWLLSAVGYGLYLWRKSGNSRENFQQPS